jgi:hypothetical protein
MIHRTNKWRETMAKITRKAASKARTKVKTLTKKTSSVRVRPDGLKVGSPAALLVDMVLRPKGASNLELCEAVGWAQCLPYMKKQAEKAGVEVDPRKAEGELTRYYGTRRTKRAAVKYRPAKETKPRNAKKDPAKAPAKSRKPAVVKEAPVVTA